MAKSKKEEIKEVEVEEVETETTVMDMLNRIVICLIIIAIILAVNTVFVMCKNSSTTKTSTTTSESSESSASSDYDVSMMNAVDESGVLSLFSDKKSYVLYIGRSTCSACVSFLPVLQQAQTNFGYTTQYLDITTVDSSSDAYSNMLAKFNKKTTLNVSGEETEGTFADFFGYTPMTIIIVNGKMVDGLIGAYEYEDFESMLTEAGFEQ